MQAGSPLSDGDFSAEKNVLRAYLVKSGTTARPCGSWLE